MPTQPYQDDLVLTISDNDDLPFSDAGSNISLDSDLPNRKKRKRSNDISATGTKKQKKALSSIIQTEESSESDDDDFGTHDGMIDPDFEFDLGVSVVSDAVEDFDGWGDGGKEVQTNGNKKGVDIDEIIARRAERLNGLRHAQTEDFSHTSESDQSSEDKADVENEEAIGELGFENDELLQADAFGGQASSDEVEELSEDGDQVSGNEDVSDSESVASPTAHPDDQELQDAQSDASSQTSEDEEEAEKKAAFFAPETHAVANDAMTKSFQQFSLSRPILRALAALSFTSPTPIQTRTIPIALQGLDIVGSAVTGSGKTAAFLLPILERLLYRPRKIPTTRVVILMPTRELAVQCYNVAVALAKYTDVTFAQVVGGFSLREQEAILKRRPDVVIATPGRFIDHMRNSASFTVENIEILVLDEADRMLEDGFADELDEILKTIPKGRQTMLFSATMTESVDKLIRVGMNRPVRASVDAKKSTVSGLTQEFVRLRPGRDQLRLATLAVLCTKVFTERTIVFFRQKKEAHRVRIIFGLLGLKAGELHGSMTQEQRITAVNAFREGRTTHLLATDLASRGLDIKNVMSVVNYEAPQSHEIYLHRVGRTARAGKSGRACTIAAEPDRKVVKAAVKAARAQGAKIVSRNMDIEEVDGMQEQVEGLEQEIEEILQEEKEEKALAQAETQINRGENVVKHQDEIMSRPKRTWFESEKDKRAAKQRGKSELNQQQPNGSGIKFTGEKKKLSNKDKKRMDDKRERLEGGRTFKKRRGDEQAFGKANKTKQKKAGGSKTGKSKVKR